MELKKYTRTIKVNGHKVNVEVTIKVDDDDNSILFDQDFESKEQESEYRRKVERGDIFAGHIAVYARAEGLEGCDSLGGCELAPNNMFNSDSFNKSVEFYLKEHAMEQAALRELTSELETEYQIIMERAAKYKKFSKEGK